MAWTYNGITIIAQELDGTNENIISKLNPHGGGSIYHAFGYQAEVLKINAKVVGNTNKDALRALAKSTSSFTLVGSEGSLGDWVLKNFTYKRTPIWRQTLDITQSGTAPVYDCVLELLED